MKNHKVKFKLGHLFIAILVIFLVLPTLVFMVGDTLISMGKKHYSANMRYYGAATMELYTKMPKIIPTNGGVYYDLACGYYNVLTDKNDYAYGGWSNYGVGNESRLDNAIYNLKRGLKLGEEDKYYTKNFSMLINTLIAKGEVDEARTYIEKAKASNNEEVVNVGKLNDIVLKVKEGEIEKAMSLCKEESNSYDFKVLYFNLLYNYGSEEEYNKAYYERVKEVEEEVASIEKGEYVPYVGYCSYDENGNEIVLRNKHLFIGERTAILPYIDFDYYMTFEERKAGENTFEGRLTKNGVGVPFQLVTLSDPNWYNYNSRSEARFAARYAYTDKYGYYKIENIYWEEEENNDGYAEGCPFKLEYQGYLLDKSAISIINNNTENYYGLFVGENHSIRDFEISTYEVIDEKNIIIDEENDWLNITIPYVEGAKEVTLRFQVINEGYYSTTSIPIDKDNSLIKIPLYNKRFILQEFHSADEKYIPLHILGNLKDAKVELGLSYIDEKGAVVAITDDCIKFVAKGGKLNYGEELIYNEKYEEGLQWFKNKIEEEGPKREYLYPILRIYNNAGYIDIDKEEARNEFEKYKQELYNIGIESIEEKYVKLWGSVFYYEHN